MSTKIYHGFRFVSADLHEIERQLRAHRGVVGKAIRTEICMHLAYATAGMIDKAAVSPVITSEDRSLSRAWRELRQRWQEIKKTGHRDPAVDYDFTLSVMPFEGKVYGIVFCEQALWRDDFLELPWVESFGYWSGGDRPEGVSREQWDERERIWRGLLPRATRPIEVGFGYDFAIAPFHPTAEEVLRQVPPRSKRVCMMGRKLAYEARVAALYAELAEGVVANPIIMHQQADDWVRTSAAGVLSVLEHTARCDRLLPEITVDMLLTGVHHRMESLH